ncbi:hypothetical protein PU560_07130 [Georgenia sp. 10Sc9-8]|uniref:DUF4333 domain-containing protein n=1 Tax=Georgenia halotolerans TaxID=3028317 RepID=A0ABT5TW04_9MICO|nr:hypothetical protein [Georgenia halotolerans]
MAGPGTRRGPSGGETVLVLVVAVLVLAFLIMLSQRFLPWAAAPEAGASPDGTEQSDVRDGSTGEDLSGLDHDVVTPSGNIACALDPDRVVCAIESYDYSVPGPVSDSCAGNAGHFLVVTAESSSLACDTSGPTPTIDTSGAEELDYGESVAEGEFRCLSEETGMTCEHTGTGRSISVARAAYSLG